MGAVEVHALRGVSLQVGRGELLSIMGPSGSGRSTMMNVLGCLDQPTSGEYHLDDVDVSSLDDNALSEIRNGKIGFVFQTFNLLPRTSVLENVELPLIYQRSGWMRGTSGCERRKRATQSLEVVGLVERARHAARHHPCRRADGQPRLALWSRDRGPLPTAQPGDRHHRRLCVTHDPNIALHTERIVCLSDGRVVADESVHGPRDARATLAALPAESTTGN
jgi:putative ABC transport system ATP-binding protein